MKPQPVYGDFYSMTASACGGRIAFPFQWSQAGFVRVVKLGSRTFVQSTVEEEDIWIMSMDRAVRSSESRSSEAAIDYARHKSAFILRPEAWER